MSEIEAASTKSMLDALGAPSIYANLGRSTVLKIAGYPLSIVETQRLLEMRREMTSASEDTVDFETILALAYDVIKRRCDGVMPYVEFKIWLEDEFVSLETLMELLTELQVAGAGAGKALKIQKTQRK